ncbi:MAG: hypothetical protein ACI8WI_003310 [Pseudoalteromonas distincta]|jgi:hypothetical protein|uniref:hypothetical protein n=1 Tax=Pseudoalteromonas distincta TaxID=77608 RepID=UPI0039E64035
MSKVHVKNGFEYKCERSNYGGNWDVTWYYKPINQKIFLIYSCSDKHKTLKADVEMHLSDPEIALTEYTSHLTRASDIKLAEHNLKLAQEYSDKVNSPDFDLRGNNPNRESKARKYAEYGLDSAESSLKTAIKYTEILNQDCARTS